MFKILVMFADFGKLQIFFIYPITVNYNLNFCKHEGMGGNL